MKVIMSGNEALARGAWESGVTVATAYPGTPSTEIIEQIAHYPEIYAEWAPNEKVALEVGLGAAIGGARVLVAMKHVGVNVAADPLFTLAYTGINGGLVLVSADDPGMHSSQNEQDNRHYARFAKVPLLEPADSREARDLMVIAFQISESFDTPVMLRTTTRVAHGQSVVESGERVSAPLKDYAKNAAKFVMLPGHARARHPVVEQRLLDLAAWAETTPLNRIRWGQDKQIGIITSGACYQYVREVAPELAVLKLGMTYPLPRDLITVFARQVREVIVIEELDPFLEDQILSWGIPVRGKSIFPRMGEFSPELVAERLGAVRSGLQASSAACVTASTTVISANAATEAVAATPAVPAGARGAVGTPVAATTAAVPAVSGEMPARPPMLCPGCPHRGVFYVLQQKKLVVAGDIGCYTLGALPPLNAMDSCICMGAGIGTALGMEKARGREFARQMVAVIGDSTFLHSGITGLLDVVYNQGSTTVIILDNSITAMTGHQQHPGTGRTVKMTPTQRVDLEALVRALGVRRVRVVDAYDMAAVEAAVTEELAADEPSVIITRRPCVLLFKETDPPFTVLADRCNRCGRCRRLGCPALASRKGQVPVIEVTTCTGCGLCAQQCREEAIVKAGEGHA